MRFISIDQNSHPFWDTIPKLASAAAHGLQGIHYVEDVDVAFTRHGARIGDERLQLRPERVYRGGTSDWGASLFYTDFLGRNPIDVRDLEPYTGFSTKALAKALDCTIDDLYDRYSGSDNWQLVGASYVEDADHHRVIGDLTLAETSPFLTTLLEHAEADVLERFPEAAAQQRTRGFFGAERQRLTALAEQSTGGRLVDLYRLWTQAAVDAPLDYGLTSEFFRPTERLLTTDPLLRAFVLHYKTAAQAYNQAVRETDSGLKALSVDAGELPFFVVRRRNGRLVRCTAFLHDRAVTAGAQTWPVRSDRAVLDPEALARDEVVAITGKAAVLVIQVRLWETGGSLLLPYGGSVYMPAAYLLERLLRQADLLSGLVRPVWRAKLNFPAAMCHCHTAVRVPAYLDRALGAPEFPAGELAERLQNAMQQAEGTLDLLRTKKGREAFLARVKPELTAQVDTLEQRRRGLARDPETRDRASAVWDELKVLRRELQTALVEGALEALHVRRLDYYNSRGAILPWTIAAGGEGLYSTVVTRAELYAETVANET